MILSFSKPELTALLSSIAVFLKDQLKLNLHPYKIILKTFASGVDFLGWVNFPNHRVLRTSTKRRMLGRVSSMSEASIQSYLGLLKHGNAFSISQDLLKDHWLFQDKIE